LWRLRRTKERIAWISLITLIGCQNSTDIKKFGPWKCSTKIQKIK
jgi:hypothetical protein